MAYVYHVLQENCRNIILKSPYMSRPLLHFRHPTFDIRSHFAEGADRRLARRTDLCRADCAASLDRPRQHGSVHLFILCFILLLLIHLESAHRSRRARMRRAAALVSDQCLAQWQQWQWPWFGGTRGEMRRGSDARRAAR